MTADTADVHDEYDMKETKVFDNHPKHHYITLISLPAIILVGGSDRKE